MPKVIFDISVSLDGLMTASGRTAAGPMGVGGQRLHEWAMGEDDLNRGLLERWVAEEGAAIAGRKTYDTSVPWWGADGALWSRAQSTACFRRRRENVRGPTRQAHSTRDD